MVALQAQRRGDLVITHLVVVAEDERDSQAVRQAANGCPNSLTLLGRQKLIQGGSRRTAPLTPIALLALKQALLDATPPQKVNAVVTGYAEEPARKGKRAVITAHRTTRPNENLTRGVFCRLHGPKQMPTEPEYPCTIHPIDFLECIVVPCLRSLDVGIQGLNLPFISLHTGFTKQGIVSYAGIVAKGAVERKASLMPITDMESTSCRDNVVPKA